MAEPVPWVLAAVLAAAGCRAPDPVPPSPEIPAAPAPAAAEPEPGPIPVLALVPGEVHLLRQEMRFRTDRVEGDGFPAEAPPAGTIR